MSTERVESTKKSEAHEDKRQFIIEQCASLFDRVGYHKTSMQMLAEEVGIGKPTLYHYFPSKHAILYAIHDAHMERLLVGLDRPAGSHPLESLQSACADILTQIAEHPGYVRAFMDHYADLKGEMRAKIRQQRRDYFQKLINIIEDGVAQGSINQCDPTMTTYAFLGMCNWAYKWYPALASDLAPMQAAERLCAPIFNGLRKGWYGIINIASIAGVAQAQGADPAYAMSKAGLLSLTRMTAAQHAGQNIRANAIAPGPIASEMVRAIYDTPEKLAKRLERVPLGRMAEPGDVSAAVAFLASDRAAYITGVTIGVDGGAAVQ